MWKENEKQNVKLDRIDRKVEYINKKTEGIVELLRFTRSACRLTRLAGKALCWIAGTLGAIVALYQLYETYLGG